MTKRLSSSPPRGAIGGAAGDAGVEYRRAVAAYAVAHGLAGAHLSGFGVPHNSALVSAVSVETDDIVDDVRVDFESGWRAYIQAKRTLKQGEPFKSAMAQWRLTASKALAANERIVLVTNKMPEWAYDLQRYLERCKGDTPGAPTGGEQYALEVMKKELDGLTNEQVEQLLKHAHIHVLQVEEVQLTQSREAVRLLDAVVGKRTSTQAWKDLVGIAGRIGRLRGGYRLEGWLDLLLAEGHHELQTSQDTPAVALALKKAALSRYDELVRRRGTFIDLRPLGITIQPLPIAEIDAEVKIRRPGEDERGGRDLLWAFLRRGRVVLTGLPGSGKSFALANLAARLLDVPAGPMPVVASLKEIDQLGRSSSFRDRLLDVITRDLAFNDRPFVRGEIDSRLSRGRIALLLDSLDETHGRRAQVVADIDDFTRNISPDVDILLATRDVAYGYAATLGWQDLRLVPPEKLPRTVHAIVAKYAEGDPARGAEWVATRERWVNEALAREQNLKETPLLPVLLSALAVSKGSRALPRYRALILHAIVKSIVERHVATTNGDWAVGELSGHSAVQAVLDGFIAEATAIAKRGGRCELDRLVKRLCKVLAGRWNFSAGPAQITSEAIIRFWDESGVFVISGADEMVRPRVELFVEIGEALNVARKKGAKVEKWVRETAEAERVEPLILAAGLSKTVTRHLLRTASDTGSYEVLSAALTALKQGARGAEAELGALVEALLRTMKGDAEAWRLWSRAVVEPQLAYARSSLFASVSAFPVDYQKIAHAHLILEGHVSASDEEVDLLFWQILNVGPLRPLPRRVTKDRGRRDGSDFMDAIRWSVLDLHDEVIAGVAARLLGKRAEAAPVVARALDNVGMGLSERLRELLHQNGFSDLAVTYEKSLAVSFRKALGSLAEFDLKADRKLLGQLAETSPAALSYQQSARLDELHDLCETLILNSLSAWPNGSEYDEWFRPWVNLAIALGGFNPSVLSAQAALTLQRIDALGDSATRFDLTDNGRTRDLDGWSNLDDPQAAVRLLVRMYYRGRDAAWAAARALQYTSEVALAVRLLDSAMENLRSSTVHQEIAARTLIVLTNGERVATWVADTDPVLRAMAARYLPIDDLASSMTRIKEMLRDLDGRVVEAILNRVGSVDDVEVRAEIRRIAGEPEPAWLCTRCRYVVPVGVGFCPKCQAGGPIPSAIAQAILEGRPKPTKVSFRVGSEHADSMSDP